MPRGPQTNGAKVEVRPGQPARSRNDVNSFVLLMPVIASRKALARSGKAPTAPICAPGGLARNRRSACRRSARSGSLPHARGDRVGDDTQIFGLPDRSGSGSASAVG